MFRIKTDIRQFNCETQEKVEKLIRNWVVRPTDLIFDEEGQSWEPIGEHPDFGDLFTAIRDGVDEDLLTTRELDEISSVTKDDPSSLQSSAILSGRRKLKRSKDADEPDEDAPLPIPEAPAGVEGVAAVGEEVTVMTERTAELLGLTDEQEQEGASEAPEPAEDLPLPTPPAGITAPEPADEPTQIVTHEMSEVEASDADLSDEYELEEIEGLSEAEGDASDADAREPSDEGAEAPEVVTAADDDASPADGDEGARAEEDAPEEDVVPRIGRHDLPEELFLTNEISRAEILAADDMLDELGEDGGPSVEDPLDWEVTQQIESPFVPEEESEEEEDDASVDDGWSSLDIDVDLRATDEFDRLEDEDEDTRETIELESPISRDDIPALDPEKIGKPSDKILVDEDYSREAGGDSLATSSESEVSAASEVSEISEASEGSDASDEVSEISEASEASDDDASADEGIELEETADFDTGELFDAPSSPPPVGGDDDTGEQDLAALEEDSDITETFDDADEALQSLIEESSGDEDDTLLDQGDDEDSPSLFQDRGFVSEGYTIPMPFKIGPSQGDMSLGIRQASVSTEEKDMAFPVPQPKTPGVLIKHRYGYGDKPRVKSTGETVTKQDNSTVVVVVVVVLVILLVATAIIFSR